MSNFWTRVITGLVLIGVIMSAVLYGALSFMLLIGMVGLLGLHEFYTLFASQAPMKWSGILLSWLLFALCGALICGLIAERTLILIVPATFTLFLMALYKRSEKPFTELAFTFLGIIYVVVPSILFVFLAFIPGRGEYEPHLVMGLLFIVWASDSGAYASGKLFGKHPLFKRVSPGKTWEGSVGGLVSALIVGFIVSFLFKEIALVHWLMIVLIVVVIGTYGDLIKSRLKRSVQVKDSGTILPGHGGILDRFDSLFSSAPFVVFYFLLLEHFRLN